jgi:thiol-disulfide isomerase/thioredoxin
MAKPRIEYIGAEWCAVCKTVAPAVKALAHRFGVAVEERSLDEMPEEQQAEITKVPTVRLHSGAPGAAPAVVVTKHVDAVRAWLTEHAVVAQLADADF